ncbi:hypothetical protein GQX73_g4048 [Xylaria multiplex]|uniref:HTH APSES-type domain-containing protein n=1 Tax=Xylaria multiplex TaxID=323545 RepID=A0A7C8IQ78_9PEZI|nr:hypothetical protein GQX73_g4048 [Xylaria multiplex]
MLSLSSLLNPAPPGPPNRHRFPPSPESSSPADSCTEESVFPGRPTMPKHKIPKDAAVFTKGKPKGAINFQPYENLDEMSLHRARMFQVYPLGKIREYARHIPYNSGKKDFFEKTGRESFEGSYYHMSFHQFIAGWFLINLDDAVFQYVFKVPGDDAEYAVMWDYNIGLVRMTPFFKCCKYPKTTPAKMLSANAGLKEITHSITGGSIMAQGYWMPYQCAKAVCATFCHNISGALIPIFGPDFPALCTHVDSPEYTHMVINPEIIAQSTREAEYYRRFYSNAASLGSGLRNNSDNASPKRDRRALRTPCDDSNKHNPRQRIRKTCIITPGSESSPYTTDTDGEISPAVDRTGLAREPPNHQLTRFLHSPIPSIVPPLRHSHSSSSGWTPANTPHSPAHHRQPNEYQTSGPSPWLSAIPRFTTTTRLQTSPYLNLNMSKLPHSQPYPSSHPFSQAQAQAQSQAQSHSQTYHHLNTTHRRLQSASDAPSQISQQELHQSLRVKRPAAQIEEDNQPDHRYQGTMPRQSRISLPQPQHHQKNKESHTLNQSIRLKEDDGQGGVGTYGADKKAALLLMNLSVRDPSFWKGTRKWENTEGANTGGPHDSANKYDQNDRNRGTDDEKLNKDGTESGNRNSQYQAGLSSTAKIGSDSVSASPLRGMFPRIKRVRSNSM